MSTGEKIEFRADPATLNEFINSLQRLFKIAIYYPTGHAILDKATLRFMSQLKALAGNNASVTLQDHGTTLMLEEIEIEADLPFVQEFKSLLATLGLVAITIDREITMAELHDFVRKMLAYKAQVIRAKQFTQIAVAELPPSITIKLKEFLARKDASISDERSGEAAENLQSFIESLSSFGLSNEEINQCKVLLDSLPERLVNSNIDLSELPQASWDDVARLLARAVRAGKEVDPDIRDRVTTHSNINALASILKKLERETKDSKSRQAINLLVSIIRKPFDDAEEELAAAGDAGVRTFPEKPAISLEQLQDYALKNRLHPKVLHNIPESTVRPETLSIMMQLARYEQTLQTQIRMQQLFREHLSTELTDQVWEIISKGLHLVIKTGKPARLTGIVRLLVDPLRRSRQASSLQLLFLTAKLCNASEGKALWPHIVNELLVCGCSSDQKAYPALCQFVARLSPAEMQQGLAQLQVLEAFETAAIAPDIFHGIPVSCYPFFAFLLQTEIEPYVSERVLGGLRRHPPDWMGRAVAPLLELKRQDHKVFLYTYLRAAAGKSLPPALKTAAARIIAEGLPEIPEDQRGEAWIPHTIAALAQLKTPETTALLQQIASVRKLLFIPEWPAACRKAAAAALADAGRRR